jgi:hypothetical protein
MKWTSYLPLLLFLPLLGCGFQEREAAVQKREAELARKEQTLLVKEKNLQLKEEELFSREQRLKTAQQTDSVTQSPAEGFNPVLMGKWNASMTCTETTCIGSAVGDTRTETWDLSYDNERVIAKAMTDGNLIRIYTGTYRNNLLELTENVELSNGAPATQMVVRLTLLDQLTMEGQREIIRSGNCRIIYALQLNKM